MLAVGNAPLSWGVFEGDAPENPPWPVVLDEIARAGYGRLELGPIGFLPEDPETIREELDRRGLALTAGFVYEHLHDPAQREAVMRNTHRVCELLARLGATYLVVIDRMVPERQRTAGRAAEAERLGPAEWRSMVETITAVAGTASADYGLRPVLHPHCGSHVEFLDEIDKALADLPHSTIGLCIDTGHSAVAGLQAADLVDCYADRVEYFHFKDVDGDALARMRAEALDFDSALGVGLFCAIGQGIVDFAALRRKLTEIRFSGFATVEQDPDPRVVNHDGFGTARESIAYLLDAGLAQDERIEEM